MTIRLLLAAALILILLTPTEAEEGERQTTESGLVYTILVAGDGEAPQAGDRVTIHYEARLADGTEIGSTRKRGRPFHAKMDPKWLIPGLFEGLSLMKAGGKARLEIPATLAYGEKGKPARKRGAPPIVPPNTGVVYDVELVEVVHGPVFQEVADESWIKMDPGLRYAVLEKGDGDPPRGSQRVRLRFSLWNHKQELVQSTFGQGKDLDGLLSRIRLSEQGPGEVFLPRIVARMKPGARYWVEVESPHTWGARPAHAAIAPNTKTWWELELEDVSDVPALIDLDRSAPKTTLPSGLEYQVLRRGSGRKAKAGRSNEVHYIGWLPDGKMFDTSIKTGKTFRTQLDHVIPGWIEGIALMREGDVFLFTIPGHLAYGEQGSPPRIGPNQTLLFWVEVKKVW